MRKRATITLKDIQQSACAPLNPHLFPGTGNDGKGKKARKKPVYKVGGRMVVKYYPTSSEEKNYLQRSLIEFCQQHLYKLFEEYVFTEQRAWRFDWCIPAIGVAFEYEGIFSEQSRHTNRKGYSNDAEKYNAAAALSWRVFRYTAMNYKNLENDLKTLNHGK